MPEIKLTPTGHLRWVSEGPSDSLSTGIKNTFEKDWRQGLFMLGTEKIDTADSQTLRYWQNIANRYLTDLCHTPESENTILIASPGEGELSTWLLTAPPMIGGEYLSVDMLRSNYLM